MIPEKALVLYKNHPALVSGRDGDKLIISFLAGGAPQKLREKDLEILHPGPAALSDFSGAAPPADIRSAWELLTGTGEKLKLKELAELIYGAFTPPLALAAAKLLEEGLYFTGTPEAITARPRDLLEEEEKKRGEKQREMEEREAFLRRMRTLANSGSKDFALNETDRHFLNDVEALARGKTEKSRTLKDLGRPENPQEAHRLLLAAGAWTMWENPHPDRFGLSRSLAKNIPPLPGEEDRLDLRGLPAFAVDNSWSNDPDVAVSLEGPDSQGRLTLWVHVADPASSITPGSPADLEARDRGASLYLPEGSYGMLAPEALPIFALDSRRDDRESSRALSFKMLLNPDLSIAETDIFPSLVKVTNMNYEEADACEEAARAGTAQAGTITGAPLDSNSSPGEILSRLFSLARQNMERRLDTGAVLIEFAEVHIHVSLGKDPPGSPVQNRENMVSITPLVPCFSAEMVRECMILAGEGAARWALRNRVAFPFVSQEAGDLPQERLPGLAGAWQLRRCMRPRSLSVKPGVHWGLGLDAYTQVTSPLRRYTDLLAHQQIRSFLRGKPLLNEEELLFRLSIADTSASVAARAERASRNHWTMVYLADKKDRSWEGMVMDRKGSRVTVIINELGLETQLNLRERAEPNDLVSLKCLSVKIPEGEIIFASN